MFVETQPEAKGKLAQWLEGVARRYPRGFTTALVLLMVGVTLGLLLAVAPPTVLYQRF